MNVVAMRESGKVRRLKEGTAWWWLLSGEETTRHYKRKRRGHWGFLWF